MNLEGLKIQDTESLSSKNRTRILIFALIFMVINTLIIILLLQDNEFINEYDKYLWNTKIILILNGVCFGCFSITLKFVNKLNIKKLFLIFLLTRIVWLYFLIIFNYGVEIDFHLAPIFMPKIFNGELFTPYHSNWLEDAWRIVPPMLLWWYAYNYWIYGLDVIIWRHVYLLLEIGIVYLMIQIFHENSGTEKGWSEEKFKIGLLFYTFSFIALVAIILYTNIIGFPVLISMLGFLFFFRSKKNPKYIYHAIFFFCIATLTEFFAAIWILGILLILIFQKKFKRFFILIGEIFVIFCVVCLPFLINDALGFLERFVWVYKSYSGARDATIWLINYYFFNLPESINYIPAILAILLTIYIVYKNYNNTEISLNFFITIICIFEFFTPTFNPLHYLWIFPLICVYILYSLRKFFITNLFFMGFFLFFIIWGLIAYVSYPGPFFPNYTATYTEIVEHYMPTAGYYVVYCLVGHLIFQMGFIYLIFSYTKSKKLVLLLLVPFTIYYTFNICVPSNLFA